MGSSNFCDQCGSSNTPTAKFCRRCGQSMHPHTAHVLQSTTQTGSLTGTLHNGQYQILRRLGQGGMGAVYLAQDLLFGGRQVAVKEMSQSGLLANDVTAAIESFQREALLLGNLRHQNLPRIYAHFQDAGRWYLVMDFIEGETLEETLSKAPGGRLPIAEVLDIGIQVSTVLHYLHTRRPPIIFRDLKPANILRDGETVFLIDFGIARHFQPGQSKDTTALGSPGYAAPEQYGKSQTTPRSDLYSLGTTLYFLLSGDNPADHPFHFPALTQPLLRGYQDVSALLQRLVEIEETKRPQNANSVTQELQRIAATPLLSSGSLTTEPRRLTLLYALADKALALEFEKQVKARNTDLVLWHNGSASGLPSTEIWPERLQTSDLFVPLVSADLWADKGIWTYIEQVRALKPAEQILPVWLRPCWLDENKFLGIAVVPIAPVTYSRESRKTSWLTIVDAIMHALSMRPSVRFPLPASSVPSLSPHGEAPAPKSPYQLSPATTVSGALQKDWSITVLFAPEEKAWFERVKRLFVGMQRTTLKALNVTFVLRQGEEGLSEQTEDAILAGIRDSRLTLALLSPNFLACEWMERYDQIQARLKDKGQSLLHIALKPCEWNNHDYRLLPEQGPIGNIGNDLAWQEIAKEIRLVLATYYPDEMSMRK